MLHGPALASATWTAIVAPGLGGGIALAALIAAGLTAAITAR